MTRANFWNSALSKEKEGKSETKRALRAIETGTGSPEPIQAVGICQKLKVPCKNSHRNAVYQTRDVKNMEVKTTILTIWGGMVACAESQLSSALAG